MHFSFPARMLLSRWQGSATLAKSFDMVDQHCGPSSVHSRAGFMIVQMLLTGCTSRSQVARHWGILRMTGPCGASWWLTGRRNLLAWFSVHGSTKWSRTTTPTLSMRATMTLRRRWISLVSTSQRWWSHRRKPRQSISGYFTTYGTVANAGEP